MDDVHLDAVLDQPPGQPKAVTPGFESDGDGVTTRPLRLASSRQRCSRHSRAVSSGIIFLSGCRSIPGTVPAISQLDWLSSITATRVASCSKGTRDLLRSLGWDMTHSIGVDDGGDDAFPSPPAP